MSRHQLSADPEQGPYLLIAFDELEAMEAFLIEHGVAFTREQDDTCVGAAFGMLRFGPGADAARIQAVLDEG